MLFTFILLFAASSLGRRDLWVFIALSAFVGVADRVYLAARAVLGASLLLVLLGILLKGH